MNLVLNKRVASSYHSFSQKVRVLTEDWVNKHIYCPNCGSDRLEKYSNNRPAADFFCQRCREDFELKSKKDPLGKKIVDGAYQSMLSRLSNINNPNFFLLSYDLSLFQVLNFLSFLNISLSRILLKEESLFPQ
jgi:type II restriction enzyme